MVVVHGDDMVCVGERANLTWLRDQVMKKYEIKVQLTLYDEIDVSFSFGSED